MRTPGNIQEAELQYCKNKRGPIGELKTDTFGVGLFQENYRTKHSLDQAEEPSVGPMCVCQYCLTIVFVYIFTKSFSHG